MTNATRLESFSKFANHRGYPTTIYRKGQPVGIYINDAWCYIGLNGGVITTIPQPLQQLFEEFEKRPGMRKVDRQTATYVRPIPRDGQPLRRRLKRLNPDG